MYWESDGQPLLTKHNSRVSAAKSRGGTWQVEDDVAIVFFSLLRVLTIKFVKYL